jgi:putative membrane protein insertion efficiency factor
MKWLVLGPLWVYRRLVSPMLPATCRYYPSCSAYAVQAVEKHGAVKGVFLGTKRLCRCHPWAAGGVDLVPDEFHWRNAERGSVSVSKELTS